MIKSVLRGTLGLGCFLLGGYGLWFCATGTFDSDIDAMPDYDYLKEIRALEFEGRFGEAEHLADFVLKGSSITNRNEIVALREEVNKKRTAFWNRVYRAGKGFVVGDGVSLEELSGAMVSDFLLWGDIRDLAKQGYNKITGKETDPVVAALAAVGVGTSVATFVAGGATAAEAVATPVTGGASSAAVPATATATSVAAVADASVSFLKMLRKTGHLTKRFSRFLVDACKRTSKAKSLDKGLGEAFVGIKNLTQGVGAARAATIMKHVDDVDSLKAVSKMAKEAAEPTMIVVRVHGAEGIKTLGKLYNMENGAILLERASRKGAPGLKKLISYAKYGARAGKSWHHGNIQKLATKIMETVGCIPVAIASGILLLLGLCELRFWRIFRFSRMGSARKDV